MKQNFPYIVGLDLGITSIGWSIIEIENNINEINHKRLIDTGVRIFDSLLDEKGNTNASIRRSFRSARKRNRRRSHRLERIKNFLIKHNLIEKIEDLENVKNTDPYFLRYKALDNILNNIELARTLLHISKRRGFKSNRKNIEKEEGGKGEYGNSIEEFSEILNKYRTVGEALYLDPKYLNTDYFKDTNRLSTEELTSVKFGHQKRNRRNRFIAIYTRSQLEKEIRNILEKQKSLGNTKITNEFIEEFISIWASQRHFFDPDKINQLVGQCSIYSEKNGIVDFEYRAPIKSFSYNTFRSLQSVINFLGFDEKTEKFYVKTFDKVTTEFIKIQIENISELLLSIENQFINEFKDFNTDHLRKLLNINPDLIIGGEVIKRDKDGKIQKNKSEEIQYEKKLIFKKQDYLYKQNKTFIEFYPELYSKLRTNLELLDKIFIVNLARYRDEDLLIEKISESLAVSRIEFDMDKLTKLVNNLENTDQYGDLSIRALTTIIPELRKGHFVSTIITNIKKELGIKENKNGNILLPPLNDNTLTNPRVIRVITETRKVINALVKKYGSPAFINVELGRDLKNSEETKRNINSYNKKLEKRRLEVVEKLKKNFNISNPSYQDIQRYMLWQDQGEKCIISMEKIPADQIFNNTEIDHAIPWSRCADDSYINKILVFKKVNQEKGNKTPFEYFGSDIESEKWKQFVNFVNSLFVPGRKKARLISTKIDEGFSSRDLNDTRYASRYIKNYLEDNLKFRKFDRDSRVTTVNGQATSIIRAILTKGLVKTRENDRHHALDSIVVAVTTRSVIKKINDFSKTWIKSDDDLKKSHLAELKEKIPAPWEGFFEDTYNRVFAEGEEFEQYKNNPEIKKRYRDIYGKVKPLFVSRAPSRKIKGPAHAETVYALEGEDSKGLKIVSSRKGIASFDQKNENRFNLYKDDPKYLELINSLEKKDLEKVQSNEILLSKDGRGKNKIFSTKVAKATNSSKPINRGNHIAYVESGQSMVRVDVFRKDGKHYLVPIYVYDTIQKELPNRAILAGKNKEEWPIIDETYTFRFSLYKNDYIKFKRKKDSQIEEGYYITIHSGVGSALYLNQDGSEIIKSGDKKVRNGDVGIKSVFMLEKYTVDPLGDLQKVKKEKRLDFKLKYKKK